MSDAVLTEDIAALNRQFLNLVARHSGQADSLCLRLNISRGFLSSVASIPSGDLERVAALGTCLLQPLVDGETLLNAAKLTPEQGQAHIRSAAKLKHVIGR